MDTLLHYFSIGLKSEQPSEADAHTASEVHADGCTPCSDSAASADHASADSAHADHASADHAHADHAHADHAHAGNPDARLHEAIGGVINMLLVAEADHICGATLRQRSSNRTNYRLGYRKSALHLRAGTIPIRVPLLYYFYLRPSMLKRIKRKEDLVLSTFLDALAGPICPSRVATLIKEVWTIDLPEALCADLTAKTLSRLEAARSAPAPEPAHEHAHEPAPAPDSAHGHEHAHEHASTPAHEHAPAPDTFCCPGFAVALSSAALACLLVSTLQFSGLPSLFLPGGVA